MKPPSERFSEALSLIPELAEVESIIRGAFVSDVAAMREIPEYLLSLGGKRIRPAITLLCAKALGSKQVTKELLTIAAGIELIHMATLMHDDIIDQSPKRRHKESPYAKFGTPLTLLSGDFLLTRAFGLCAQLDDTVISATERACIELVEGEALETPLYVSPHNLESCLLIARRKTASLFKLSAFCAGHLGKASTETLHSLSAFGEAIGIAFQIIDDVLDVTSDEATLGKQPGLDILERKPSVVNVLWLASGEASAKRLMQPPAPAEEESFMLTSLGMLKNSTFVQEAKDLARNYGTQAVAALNSALPTEQERSQPAARALYTVVEFALERLL